MELLPTAESDLEDEMMGKRWLDAVLGALLLIGVLVAMAQFSAAVGNLRFPTAAKRLVAHRTASKKPVASSRNACVLTLNEDPAETRPMLTEPEKESAGIPGFYECELSLWLGKSTILLVCYVLVMMSRCMMNNGSAGIVGRLWVFRWSPSLPSNASQRPIASQTMPLAVPFRVDLLKDCIFTASVLQLAACAEDEGTRQRMEVAKEFLPALGVRLQAFRSHNVAGTVIEQLLPAGAEFIKVMTIDKTLMNSAPAVAAEHCSTALDCDWRGILAIRWLLLKFPVYIFDPSAIAIMALMGVGFRVRV
ncbi:unnamed protein product [Symbiodinium microadriaticum]|nr:unnamed protein product [Symbiodinium microadriaticum]CAE7947849.1 unnamed protein product [Symbiodinium sp. KB8]